MAQTTTKTDVAILEPKLATGGKLQPIIPQNWGEAVQMAGAFVRAGMVPKHFEGSVEKATVAILAGLEVGMTPMTSLQSIAVINNMPTIFGDGMLGLVRASGYLEDIEEGVEWDKDQPVAATCRVKRKGEKTWGTHTFTIQDAIKGGLLAKPGPWKQYPQRMLQMRARAWALRDKFADVLRGLQSREEIEDMIDVTPAAPPAAEPKRSDYETPPGTPPRDQAGGQGQAGGDDAPAGGDKAKGSPAQPDPEITDVVDQNEDDDPRRPSEGKKIVFGEFSKTADFMEFAEDFLQHTNREGARQFGEYYENTLTRMGKGNDATKEAAQWVRNQVKALMEPGADG
jgi:RecT family protein